MQLPDRKTWRLLRPRSLPSLLWPWGRTVKKKVGLSLRLSGGGARPCAAGFPGPGRNLFGGLTNGRERPMFWSESLLPSRYRVPRQRQTTRKGGTQSHGPYRGSQAAERC
jgi:hypothetical protein